MTGRRTKLNPELQDLICKTIQEGMPYSQACRLAGIDYQTLLNWKARGRNAKTGLFFEFFEALSRAEATAMQQMVKIVRETAAKGSEEITVTEHFDEEGKVTGSTKVSRVAPRDWRAAMAMLERRNPEAFGRQIIQHEKGEGISTEERVVVTMVFDDGEGEDNELDADTHAADAQNP